jgi:twitching motility protein PilT
MNKIDTFLKFMNKNKASDLHFTSNTTPHVRINGDIMSLNGENMRMSPENVKTYIYEIMPDINKKEFEKCGDTDFAYETPDVGRFRVNVFLDLHGPGAVFREIPTTIPTADDLSLPQTVRNLTYLEKGLIIVTGPTGSGKSTTLAAIIDLINKTQKKHIITIEDPVEFVHTNQQCLINHREIHKHTISFKKALRAALREDPDIVLIGEMRDLETVEIAIETAETGHLVFGTLHTTTAPSTVNRIIDQFPADRQDQIRTMLSESLKAVIAQNLLKKTDGSRIAAMEILIANSAVSNLIREAKTYQIPSIMQAGKKYGMQMFDDVILNYAKKGIIHPLEGYKKSLDKDLMIQNYKKNEIKFDIENNDSE